MIHIIICGALLSLFILKLKDQLKDNHYVPETKNKFIIKDIYDDLVYLFHVLKPGKFIGPLEPLNNVKVLKNLVMVEDNESYTINKKIIHLCTKDPHNGKYYDKNTLMYVVLHELAHVLCNDLGHTEKFIVINHALLEHAIKHGFYDPSKPFVQNYCSL